MYRRLFAADLVSLLDRIFVCIYFFCRQLSLLQIVRGPVSGAISMGDGDDILFVRNTTVYSIDMGDGEDRAALEYTTVTASYVQMGAGNDFAEVCGSSLPSDLKGGSGDDCLIEGGSAMYQINGDQGFDHCDTTSGVPRSCKGTNCHATVSVCISSNLTWPCTPSTGLCSLPIAAPCHTGSPCVDDECILIDYTYSGDIQLGSTWPNKCIRVTGAGRVEGEITGRNDEPECVIVDSGTIKWLGVVCVCE